MVKAGRKKRLVQGRIYSFTLDNPSYKKLLIWRKHLRSSRSAALRQIIKEAPEKPQASIIGENDGKNHD